MSNRQPEKRRLKPLFFLDFIFWTFSEGKVGHLFLKGKVGQPVQNLLQVTNTREYTLSDGMETMPTANYAEAVINYFQNLLCNQLGKNIVEQEEQSDRLVNYSYQMYSFENH